MENLCKKCIEITDNEMEKLTIGISKYILMSGYGLKFYKDILNSIKNNFHHEHKKETE